jgi:hypothetical protein
LIALRGIDAVQPYLHGTLTTEDPQRVAIKDPLDLTDLATGSCRPADGLELGARLLQNPSAAGN